MIYIPLSITAAFILFWIYLVKIDPFIKFKKIKIGDKYILKSKYRIPWDHPNLTPSYILKVIDKKEGWIRLEDCYNGQVLCKSVYTLLFNYKKMRQWD